MKLSPCGDHQRVAKTGFSQGARESRMHDRYTGVTQVQLMNESTQNNIPLLLWPFYAIWRLLTFVLNITGRVICLVLGIALMMGGVAIALTVVGAPPGIALTALGFLLVVRALF